MTIRADSGFWSYDMFNTLNRLGVGWSITTPLWATDVRKAIAGIRRKRLVLLSTTPKAGLAQVAETTIFELTHRTRSVSNNLMKLRLIIRRSRSSVPKHSYGPTGGYHTFVTNLNQPTAETDQHHHLNTDTEDRGQLIIETDR